MECGFGCVKVDLTIHYITIANVIAYKLDIIPTPVPYVIWRSPTSKIDFLVFRQNKGHACILRSWDCRQSIFCAKLHRRSDFEKIETEKSSGN